MPRRVPLPTDLTARPFGVAKGREAGFSAHRLRAADLDRPFQGIRTLRGQAATLHGKCLAYLERMPPEGFFSHLTAARIWHVPMPWNLPTDEIVHVSVPAPKKAPRGRGIIGHKLFDEMTRIVPRFDFPVADPASTWCHLGAFLSVEDLVAAGDHLVLDPYLLDPSDQRPYLSISQLRARLEGFSGRGARACARAMDQIREGAESRQESLLRLAMMAHGLPEPELNQEVFGASGNFIARVDMIYRMWRLIVEYDGEQHRTDSAQYDRDMERRERLIAAGWRIVHVRKRGMRGTPSAGVLKVEAALRAAGWRP